MIKKLNNKELKHSKKEYHHIVYYQILILKKNIHLVAFHILFLKYVNTNKK